MKRVLEWMFWIVIAIAITTKTYFVIAPSAGNSIPAAFGAAGVALGFFVMGCIAFAILYALDAMKLAHHIAVAITAFCIALCSALFMAAIFSSAIVATAIGIQLALVVFAFLIPKDWAMAIGAFTPPSCGIWAIFFGWGAQNRIFEAQSNSD